jgi:perosamine synthetase
VNWRREVPPSQVVIRDDEIAEAVDRLGAVLRSGTLTHGPETRRFEARFADFLSVSHVVATSSGTSALEIAIRAIDIGDREVLTPTNTNFATGIAVLNAGATLRFYDSGLYPDVDSLTRNISDRTGAVIVVHIGGHITPAIDDIEQLCRRQGIALIEDAAHAHGSHLGGRQAGSFGRVGAFSFYETKVLTTGEGGALVTNDDAIADAARSFRNQGFRPGTDLHVRHGNTWRMSEMEAVLGQIQLRSLEHDASHRTSVIRRYAELLADDPQTSFPELSPSDGLSGYKCVAMLDSPERREPLRLAMASAGVELDREVYSVPLHRQPIFEGHVVDCDFPVADRFADTHICLPIWRSINNDVVDHVATVLRRELARCGDDA